MLDLFRVCPYTHAEEIIVEREPVNNARMFKFKSPILECILVFESENRKGYWFAMSLPNGTKHQMFFPKSEWNVRK